MRLLALLALALALAPAAAHGASPDPAESLALPVAPDVPAAQRPEPLPPPRPPAAPSFLCFHPGLNQVGWCVVPALGPDVLGATGSVGLGDAWGLRIAAEGTLASWSGPGLPWLLLGTSVGDSGAAWFEGRLRTEWDHPRGSPVPVPDADPSLQVSVCPVLALLDHHVAGPTMPCRPEPGPLLPPL